jgi:hypothetical protein
MRLLYTYTIIYPFTQIICANDKNLNLPDYSTHIKRQINKLKFFFTSNDDID